MLLGVLGVLYGGLLSPSPFSCSGAALRGFARGAPGDVLASEGFVGVLCRVV